MSAELERSLPEGQVGVSSNTLPEALRQSAGVETPAELWQALQEIIRGRLGQTRYSVWFQQTELMKATEGQLVVGVPNVVIQQFLTARYAGVVGAAAEELLGRPMSVAFQVAPSLFRRMRSQLAAAQEEQAAGPISLSALRRRTALCAQWSFDNLIVTRCNRLSFAAARELAGQENPRVRFLYVCGDFGVGKTALLRAIYALAADPEAESAPILMSAEDWCNQYYHAIQHKTTRLFRARYRACRMLLLDDVQFIEGKAGAQAELLHTAKHILGEGGRVVLSGTPHPENLKDIDPALRAFLRTAFPAVLLQIPPDERRQVAKELARRRGLKATDEVFDYVARTHGECFARMEAAINCLALYAGVEGSGKVEITQAMEALAAVGPASPACLVTLEQVKRQVLSVFPVAEKELVGRSRLRTVCQARHLALYLARKLTGASLTEIGRFFGGLSHSTVKHAVEKLRVQLDRDAGLRALAERLEERLTGGSPS